MRLTALAAIAVATTCAALLAAGCGGGSSGGSATTAPPKKATAPNAPAGSKVVACKESSADAEALRVTAIDCATADRIMRRWQNHRSCALADGASRGSCSLGSFRCQAVKAEPGVAVSCARPGGDIAFIVTKTSGSG
ncbi:MAG: hypothetical protein ACRDPE_12845 [Solirubrobacterales bacterium]